MSILLKRTSNQWSKMATENLQYFFEKYIHVDLTTKCWIWLGTLTWHGYGQVFFRGKNRKAHRVIAHLIEGRDLEGSFHTRHSCNNKSCVNPQHTKKGTAAENGKDFADQNIYCRNGHLRTSENTMNCSSDHRRCKICFNESKRLYKQNRKRKEGI